MSRKAFTDDEFFGSNTLRNVSANLQTIKRMMGWGTAEMSNKIGISDRHLDSLLRMSSNVTVLVLEKIADGLGIDFRRLTGTRIKVREHTAGANFLEELRKEAWHISSDDVDESSAAAPLYSQRDAPSRRGKDSASRKGGRDAKVEAAAAPTGMDSLIERLVGVQERLASDQSKLDTKVDRLADQVQSLARVMTQRGAAGTSASNEASPKRGAKGAAKRRAEPDTDLFDRSAPDTGKRRGRPAAKEVGSRKPRGAGMSSRGTESVKVGSGGKGSTPSKRAYNRKK